MPVPTRRVREAAEHALRVDVTGERDVFDSSGRRWPERHDQRLR